jgi:iron complex outermembrane receptor protein
MRGLRGDFRAQLMGGAAIVVLAMPGAAFAGERANFNIPPQQLASALNQFGAQSGHTVLAPAQLTAAKTTRGFSRTSDPETALRTVLAGTGLTFARDGDVFAIVKVEAPRPVRVATAARSADAEPDGAVDLDAVIVTAQKREENIQDVPIAMSAFTQEELTTRQVAGGADLMTQIPNVTFTKTNFTGYSIQIRGIGTQAVSATTDAAVAIAFNNTAFIRNRFFEQEFYDLGRIEVLRGPQGTLYGRNATAGVVNLISAKPRFVFDSKASIDVGNYGSRRLEGMLNVPLADDVVAVRLAGAWTKRDGFSTNQLTGQDVDGRDLWSTRLSLRFEPTDRLSANFIWEHFEEDDDRLRSGKQVCKKDPGPMVIGGIPVPQDGGGTFSVSAYTSQGCLPASMYADESFQTPNGFALPFYGPTSNLGNPVHPEVDPYASATQSRDLRVIESMVPSRYRARSDVAEFQVNFDLTDSLTLTSETAYSTDSLFSTQDYNRFNTKPGAFGPTNVATRVGLLDANNVFCDPQLGCSDRLLLADLSTAESRHFSQEFRLSSDFDGPFNFSLGGNFLRYDTEDKYYVFANSLTMFAADQWGGADTPYVPGVSDNTDCQFTPGLIPDPRNVYAITSCVYVDPNPIGKLNDQGRNYFLSRNPYRLISYAAFGEAYYNITPDLKLTGGLRWTVDKKHAPQIPSWLLASQATGDYPVAEIIDQEWSEPTGRLAIDWKPDFSFTDETLIYASYAHGYKAGGANPPPPVIATYGSFDDATVLTLQNHPKTFDAEYVDAFEIGTKNTLFDGALTLNMGAFYYDYRGYQISQIIDRAAVNLNFDAEVWGAEIEADWRPTDNLRLGFKGGYEGTRLADGSGAVDTMDRTAGDPNWVLIKPFPTIPSNCILPAYVVAAGGALNVAPGFGGGNGICVDAYYSGMDPGTHLPYTPNPTIGLNGPLGPEYAGYPGFDPLTAPNGGTGITKDLSGNELPNAPHFTGTFTADYTIPLRQDWALTLHADLYYQSEAWTRVFNTEGYDKLKAYTNVNFAAQLTNQPSGLQVMLYVKNVFDRDSITGAFLNSDDTGLTTNVFLTEPRLFGVRVTKQWDGEPLLGNWFAGEDRDPGQPYRWQVEIGASTNRFLADDQAFKPGFVNAYQAPLKFPLSLQDQDLDWGDQRDIKISFAPTPGWRVAAAYRYGRTDGSGRAASYQQLPGGVRTGGILGPRYYDGPINYGISTVSNSEEHSIIDFMVGKDVGIGAWGEGGQSQLGFGLRYAQFKSSSSAGLQGTPDWFFPAVDETKYPSDHHSEFAADLTSEREFKGVGPVLSWEASRQLFAADNLGRVGLDWSVSGGVLFGKQTTRVEGNKQGEYHHWPQGAGQFPPETVDTLYNDPIDLSRSDKVTVPTYSLSLGLSYEIDRVKVSAGYRWERYLDAIDGGVDKAQSFDRGVDGPYVKFRLGF